MKISVVVTVYNLEKYVAEALQSVFDQTRKADEIIVVDDCSTDGTQEILKSFGDKITYVRLATNSGAIFNSLTGVKKCSGDVVCMLDGDDVWAENKLEVVEKCFSGDKDLILLSHRHVRADENLKPLDIYDDTHENIQRILNFTSNQNDRSRLFRETILQQRGYWLGSAYSFKRDKFDVNLFEEIINSYDKTRYAYLDLVVGPFLVLTNPKGTVAYTPETFFKYRIHGSQSFQASAAGHQPNVDSLFKSVLIGKSTNELIYKVMERCGAQKKDLRRRLLLIEYYDFLSALYNKNSAKALGLFIKLSGSIWTMKTSVKEFKRLVYVSIFGVSSFLKYKSK